MIRNLCFYYILYIELIIVYSLRFSYVFVYYFLIRWD